MVSISLPELIKVSERDIGRFLILNKGHLRPFRVPVRCRSYVGYPPVARKRPNPTHFAISALQYMRHIHKLITQNVDGLHLHAKPSSWSDFYASSKILELHGTLHVRPPFTFLPYCWTDLKASLYIVDITTSREEMSSKPCFRGLTLVGKLMLMNWKPRE
jgi:hypothetical protein